MRVFSLSLCLFACGASPDTTGGPPDGDSGTFNADAGGDSNPIVAQRPSLVFVNGLVGGVASNTLTLDDVRVCIPGIDYPLPNDQPMPLANYPGIARGRGIDLGPFTGAVTTIAVFSAKTLAHDNAWTGAESTCAEIQCTQGAACEDHVELPVTLGSGANVVVLRDAASGQVELRVASLVPTYSGQPQSLEAEVANFSGWHDGEIVNAYFGNANFSGSPIPLAAPLAPAVVSNLVSLQNVTDYEGTAIWLEQMNGGQVADRFSQSLGSIQYVSNPATSPAQFYSLRENIAFVMVGDVNDTSLATNGRSATFDGKALHIVAVPFAASSP